MVVRKLNNIVLQFNSFNFADNSEHINKMPYSGICLKVNTPSDGTPCGSNKPVAFSKEAIEKALTTFVGMGVNCVYNEWDSPEYALTGHDMRFKIGVVEEATLEEDGVHIKGNLWKRDFSDVCFQIKNAKDSLGFSVEVCVNDMKDSGDFYLVEDFTFTGVAILYKNLAAFKSTQLVAQQKKESDKLMTEEQMQQILALADKLTGTLESIDKRLENLEAKETTMDFSEIVTAVTGLGEKIDAKQLEVTVPQPKTAMNFAKKLDNQKAMELSDKCNEIDGDSTIPAEMKAKAKMDAFRASLKSQSEE